MKNIHVLPTGKPSRLYYSGNNTDLLLSKELISFKTFERSPQDLYITNDEKIKEGDWLLSKEGIVHNNWGWNFGDKKIILTTDEDLINDGIQAIEDEFLEWFIKNPSCDEVETYSLGIKNEETGESCHYEYEIIIPKEVQCTCKEHDPYCCQIHGNCPTCVKKEEPKQENCCTPLGQIKRYEDCYGCDRKPKQEKLTYTESAKKEERISNSIMMKRKQETLEEVAERYGIQIYKGKMEKEFDKKCITETLEEAAERFWLNDDSMTDYVQRAYITGFIQGAKWMQERMYSEKEVESLLHKYMQSQIPDWHGWSTTKWFEQFKKK
jgi:hypothetical protein